MAGDSVDTRELAKGLAVLALAIVVVSPILQVALDLSGQHVAIHPEEETATELAGGDIPDTVTVSATREQAVALTTDASAISYTASLNTSQSWTACTYTQLDEDAALDATYTLLGYESGTITLHYHNQTWLAYYAHNNSSATASLPAPSPRDWTLVCAAYDNSSNTLQAYRNDQRSPGVNVSGTTSRPVSITLDGRLDEIRLFQQSLNNSSQQQLADEPVAPLPGRDRVARIMFDTESPDVYFAGGTVSVTETAWVTGLRDPGLLAGSDYELLSSPFRVAIPDGSYVAGAPVVWVSWGGPFAAIATRLVTLGGAAFTLAAVGLLALGAGYVTGILDRY